MNRRLSALYIIFILVFFGISIRLFYWQIVASERLSALAQSQRSSEYLIRAKRGTISTSDGSDLVVNQHAYLVYAEPYKIEDPTKATNILSRVLSIDSSTISAQLSDRNARWKPLARKVDESVKTILSQEHLIGVGFLEESKRFYPEGSMAAQLLGFVGSNAKGEDQGYFGIEGYYDEQLKGRDGERREENDALGHPILLGNMTEIPAEDGRHLTLTIDKTMQFIVEEALRKGIQKYGAKGGTVTLMDPYSGEILAMSSYPSYDPGMYNLFPSEYYVNPIVASSYEPGSTFKVLVVASALQSGKVPVTQTYEEEGPVRIGGYAIRTWNNQYHGHVNLAEILQHSSNVGMVYIQRQMGEDILFRAIQDIGFGEETGVDLQEEVAIPIRERSSWHEIDYATSSFGQGIAVTPLQMIRAVSTIANGGKLMKPHVVKEITTSHGKHIKIQPEVERVLFKDPVPRQVAEMMEFAVNEGEAKFSRIKGYRVSGKTGTAQIAIAGHYDDAKTIASFVGFAPTDNPKFIMLVTLNEPTSSPWGSETAAPLFFTIARDVFTYLGIPSQSGS